MATISNTALKQAKAEAKKLFEETPGVVGFGIGDQCIRIYIKDASVKAQLPSQINEISIEIVMSGEIKPFAATA